ncbi:DUF1963 domain-containing protein [Actinoplanes missouriensis]|uniref:DUF1963 domain-containing protein n=1 Tax=Actinoplanes missouriensis TaxID=1866 RepID=UPI0033E9C6DA
MDHHGRFRHAALERGVPDDEISTFLGHLRLAISLSGGVTGVPAGQFGGTPQLPAGLEWPSAGAGPLPFVFAVDCAALPRIDGMPATGSLLFFLDHEKAGLTDEPSHARVLHAPDAVPVSGSRYAAGAALVAELPEWFDPGEDDDEDEDDLSPFRRQLLADRERDLPHLGELRALADDLWPDGGAGAYLGGYPAADVITSIAEQTLAGNADIPVSRWYSAVEREAHRLTGEWLSLASFPAGDEFYSANFVIRHDDLAAGRLDRAFATVRFSE